MTSSADDTFRLAISAMQAGKLEKAERLFRQALQMQPRHVPALNLLGILLMRLERFDEAELYIRRALQENATSDATLYNHGLILKALKRPAEALERFTQALAINASVAETWNNRGVVFNNLRRYQEAIDDFDRALSIAAHYPAALFNKGNSLAKLERYEQALATYNSALALKPDLAEAWLGRGNVSTELGRYVDALAAYERALALNPHLADAWLGRGTVLIKLERYRDGIAAYDRALTLKPDLDYVASLRLDAKLRICDWTDLHKEMDQLVAGVRERNLLCDPFPMLAIESSPADQLQSARLHMANQPTYPPLCDRKFYAHDRIRLAYLSADFRDHPVAQLAVGLFEQHDRSRFEVTGISFGSDQSPTRARVKAAFERFIDVDHKSGQEIADFIKRSEIDIAVDLMGHTRHNRLNVFARRAAPIQVNYLGYPGTTGTDYVDYILGDSTVIPKEHFAFYAEKVIWLPDSYQVNDDRRSIAEQTPTRRQCGLPEAGFVFCCFNQNYKIMPEIFDIWMRLLREARGSVLWLLEGNSIASGNLRAEAQKRGVAPERLVFAPRANTADHLARQRLADLFLDTLPYNAHTTASDAVWAGLPVITCLGAAFPGRVAASVLKAAGLDELITTSLADYEALALKLARDPARLAALKDKIAINRGSCPLFDTKRFARNIEQAYTTMVDIQRRGEAPHSFSVAPPRAMI